MKKILFLLGGVTLLTACNEDALVEQTEQTEQTDQYSTYSFNNYQSGLTHGDDYSMSGPIWEGEDYYSPWDIWYRQNTYGSGNLQPNYIFNNSFPGNEKEFQTSPYRIRIYAYVGLAYYDGVNDGVYDDVAVPGLQYNLNNGSYPNLYANNQEVGNLVRTDIPFTLAPGQSIRIEDESKHLLMSNISGAQNKYPSLNGNQLFVFNSITIQERELLATYGKVFFYEVQVMDAATGVTIAHDFMHIPNNGMPSNIGPMDPLKWHQVTDAANNHLTGNAPGGIGSIPLYYYKDGVVTGTKWLPHVTTGTCDSREVIFDVPNPVHTLPLNGTDELQLGILGSARHGWLNASYYLSLH